MGDTTLYDGKTFRIELTNEKTDEVDVYVNDSLEYSCMLDEHLDTELLDDRLVTAFEAAKNRRNTLPKIEFIDNTGRSEILDVDKPFEIIGDSALFGEATVFYNAGEHSDATEMCTHNEKITDKNMSHWSHHWQFSEMNLITE